MFVLKKDRPNRIDCRQVCLFVFEENYNEITVALQFYIRHGLSCLSCSYV